MFGKLQISTHGAPFRYLNTNGPLHVGGVSFGGDRFREVSDLLGLDRSEMPRGAGFAGCVRNLTFAVADGASGFTRRGTRMYDLGSPADGESFTPGCDDEFVQAVRALNINPR